MMRLPSRASDDELREEKSTARRPERSSVPPKAQKLLGEKGHLGFNIEESIIISGSGPHAGAIDVPPKAQKVLGERAKVRDVRVHEARHADPDSLWHVRDAERQRSTGNSDNASYPDSDTVPGARKGATLPQGPVAFRSSEDVRPASNGSTLPTATSSWGTRYQRSVESLGREYYDSTTQPPLVSQQTSESSVRDMALRKGGTMMYDSSSETRLVTPKSRDSTTRQPLPDRSVSDSAPPRQQKKIGLRSLLPHGRSDARAGAGGKFARPPPSSSPASSESFPREAGHGSRLMSTQASDRRPGKTKSFHADVYDNRKTNVRRPPKGIKNWFDGFDISSEEEEQDPVELPAVEAANKGTSATREALPSVFSLYGPPTRDFTPPGYVDPKLLPARNSSLVHNTRPTFRDQTRRKNSQDSTTAESASSGAVDGRKRSGESRLARSRLGAQSVLSLSSGSDDEATRPTANRDSVGHSTIVDARATSFDLHRVATPTGAVGSQHPIEQATNDAKVRRTNSHSSGLRSNPFRDGSTNYNSTPRIPSREAGSMFSGTSSNARRWQYGWNGSWHRRSNVQSPYERDGGESAGGETSSSVPTDASRLMHVTEEEMILLELMRQKRAAMQKHSFAEGYRLARRQREQLHFNSGQDTPSDPALLVLKKRSGSRMTSRELSYTDNLIRQELEQRKRLSALRKEEVDKAFKIGRFLEMDSLTDESSSKIDRFLDMDHGLAGDFSGRPVSGTEIEIDSRFGDNEDQGEEMQSRFDEEEGFHDDRFGLEGLQGDSRNESEEELQRARTPQPIISPMQRLTNQVRAMGNDVTSAKSPISPMEYDGEQKTEGPEVADGSLSLEQPSFRGETAEKEISGAEAGDEEMPLNLTMARSPRSRGLHPLQVYSARLPTQNSQDMRIESPDIPVATTWARPTSLKHPRPQRQQPVLDFTPLEHQHLRTNSLSLSADQASPLTPSFDATLQSPDARSRAVEARPASSPQNASQQFQSPLGSHPLDGTDFGRGNRKAPPARIDAAGDATRVASMASITSAAEDILAAWAELGGGTELRKRGW